jgi:hypothetical protein
MSDPARDRRWAWGLVPVALASGSLAYGASFDLDAFDSSELALVAVSGGLGHPPGQPVHTMLGWLLTRGPWRPLTALAWLSIAPTVLAFVLASRAVRGERASDRSGLVFASACLLLCVGLGPVRDVASRVEVYALAAALAVGAMSIARSPRGLDPRGAVSVGVLWGLAGAVNPVIAAQASWGVLAPSLALRRGRTLATVALAALFAVAASYVYPFAVRSREVHTLVWSAPSDAGSFVALILARDFSQNVSLGPAGFARNALSFALDAARSGVGVLLAVGLWGLARRRGGARDPWLGALAFATAVGGAMVASNAQYLQENPDYGGYLLLACALAFAGVLRAADDASVRARWLLSAGCAALGLAGAWAHGRPAGAIRSVAARALEGCPPRAIVVLGSDHLLFPALYLQAVEGVRPDVTVLNPGWASSSWAWRWAMTKDPSLRVDLRPGLGRVRRLEGALRARAPERPVLAERVESLALARRPEDPLQVCPRGVLWSTAEGCGDARSRSTVGTVEFLRVASAQARARRARWDQRALWSVGISLGDGARALGCAGLSARIYAASVGERAPSTIVARCGNAPWIERDPPGFLQIEDAPLRARLARAVEAASGPR